MDRGVSEKEGAGLSTGREIHLDRSRDTSPCNSETEGIGLDSETMRL